MKSAKKAKKKGYKEVGKKVNKEVRKKEVVEEIKNFANKEKKEENAHTSFETKEFPSKTDEEQQMKETQKGNETRKEADYHSIL